MKNFKMAYKFLKVGSLLIASLSAFVLLSLGAMAQGSSEWTPQGRIPYYNDFTEEPPFLVADQNRTIHAFNSQPLDLDDEDSPQGVFYRQWTPGVGWNIPTDIIIDYDGRDIVLMDIYLDEAGIIHTVSQIEEKIFYAKAPLFYAEQASAWSRPYLIGEQAKPAGPGLPYMAAIAGDGQGNLAVIFSGDRDGNGIYTVYSLNDGGSWSDPAVLFLTYDEKLVSAEPRLLGDGSGNIHAIWTVFDEEGIGASAYYSQFDFKTQSWIVPNEIDKGGFGLGVKYPIIFEVGNDLFMTYYQGETNGNWWRRSSDGGITWTEPAPISPVHVGTNGPTSIVMDSDEELHLFFGGRIDDNNHGMWHSIWNGQQWTEPEAVVRGPQVKDVVGGIGFDPRSARAVVVNGNIVLLTWGTDGAAGENGAWYSYKVLNTPELPKVPLPVPDPTPEATSTAVVTAESNPPPSILTTQPEGQVYESTENPLTPVVAIIIGVSPVVLLILFIGAGRLYASYFSTK